MDRIVHHWNAPAAVHTAPRGASVVCVSNCGRTLTLPAWQVLEWDAKGTKVPPPGVTICPDCIDVATSLQSTEARSNTP